MDEDLPTVILITLSVLFSGVFLGALLVDYSVASSLSSWLTAIATVLLAAFAARGLHHFRKMEMMKKQSELSEQLLDDFQPAQLKFLRLINELKDKFDWTVEPETPEMGERVMALVTHIDSVTDLALKRHFQSSRVSPAAHKSLMIYLNTYQKYDKTLSNYRSNILIGLKHYSEVLDAAEDLYKKAGNLNALLSRYYRMEPGL